MPRREAAGQWTRRGRAKTQGQEDAVAEEHAKFKLGKKKKKKEDDTIVVTY